MQQAIVVFDIDGVVRDVGGSYRRAIADTVEHFTRGQHRPSMVDLDGLKAEGIWNNDWKASQELIYRYFEQMGRSRQEHPVSYEAIVEYFQIRYRGPEEDPFSGYISQEPLLMSERYLQSLSKANIGWGFFSGATRGSAEFVLEKRLGLKKPLLVAMGEAPDKPDPAGLFKAAETLSNGSLSVPVIYAGDTVADMHTIRNAKQQQPKDQWIAVGILPPHVQKTAERAEQYTQVLKEAGAHSVMANIERLTPTQIAKLISN